MFEYAKEHNDEVFPPSQTLHIVLAAQGFLAYLLYFCHARQFYDLIIDGCPVKYVLLLMLLAFFSISKVQKRLKSCKRVSVLFFCCIKLLPDSNVFEIFSCPY